MLLLFLSSRQLISIPSFNYFIFLCDDEHNHRALLRIYTFLETIDPGAAEQGVAGAYRVEAALDQL